MTTNRNLKRLVRARMVKTGERYTTALAHLLAEQQHEHMRELSKSLGGVPVGTLVALNADGETTDAEATIIERFTAHAHDRSRDMGYENSGHPALELQLSAFRGWISG